LLYVRRQGRVCTPPTGIALHGVRRLAAGLFLHMSRGPHRSCGAQAKGKPMANLPSTESCIGYEVRFESLFDPGKGFTFPCNERGVVDLDALSERARHNYFYARTVVGREFASPKLSRCGGGAT
jgi:hypothetical protein